MKDQPFSYWSTTALVASTAGSAHAAPGSLVDRATSAVDAEATSVLSFWREAGPSLWFAKDPTFDQRFRDRFRSLYERAARERLASWLDASDSALALILLLDQYPRNAYRGTPRMYESDDLARAAADRAIRDGHDRRMELPLRVFCYLPFGHSESLADQQRSVELAATLPPPSPANAQRHFEIIRRFGRFPHRNPIIGRAMRPEEQRYLDEGGFAG